jgi:DNA-binding transcriptional LysR family regulator
MDRIQALQVFVAVAEAESFAAGARAVNLSAPSATRGVNALEERLGTRLFTRTTRRVRLTDIGKAYLEDARQILAHLQAADDQASGAAIKPSGRLRLTSPHEFGRIYVMPILRAYLDAYPDVSAEIVMVDRVVNLVEEGFDLAVRIGALPSSGLSAVRVGQVRRMVCGAPEYFEKHGVPRSPDDLHRHQIISIASSSGALDWQFAGAGNRILRPQSRLTVSSVAAGIEAAQSGWGLTRVLSYQIGRHLERGTLQTVLEEFEPDPLPIHLVHVDGRMAAAKVRSFIELAQDRLRANSVLN